MNNTNLGANMGGLLASRPSPVDRAVSPDRLAERSVEKPNDNSRNAFKDSMSSIESPQEKRIKEKTETRSVKESENNDSKVQETEKPSKDDVSKTDNVSTAKTTKDEHVESVQPDSKLNPEVENTGDFQLASDSALSSVEETPLLSPSIQDVLLEEAASPTIVLPQQVMSVLSDEAEITPVIPELAHAVQQIVAQVGTQKNGTVSAQATINTLAQTSASVLLPTAQLLNKLSGDISALSPSDLPEGAVFDISAALNKEPDKALTSPLLAASPLAAKTSTDSLLPSQLSLNTSFKSAGQWGEAVTEKVMWMSSKGIKEATIQLDPPELGSLQVKVGVNQDQAQVSFTVQNASVREALDQQSMRLREMFAEDGLNLTDVDVSDQSAQEEQTEQGDEQQQNRLGQNGSSESEEVLVTSLQSNNQSYSLIDAYI